LLDHTKGGSAKRSRPKQNRKTKLGTFPRLVEAPRIPLFPPRQQSEQIAVGNGTEGFRAVAIVAQIACGKDRRPELTVFGFQAFECGEGNAVSAVKVVESFKEFGFALVVRVTPVRMTAVRAAALALRL
jgi:hypothetical protein